MVILHFTICTIELFGQLRFRTVHDCTFEHHVLCLAIWKDIFCRINIHGMTVFTILSWFNMHFRKLRQTFASQQRCPLWKLFVWLLQSFLGSLDTHLELPGHINLICIVVQSFPNSICIWNYLAIWIWYALLYNCSLNSICMQCYFRYIWTWHPLSICGNTFLEHFMHCRNLRTVNLDFVFIEALPGYMFPQSVVFPLDQIWRVELSGQIFNGLHCIIELCGRSNYCI